MFFNINSYAKLNLFLSIKGITKCRKYHNISSLLVYTDLHDKISIKTKKYSSGLSISFGGKFRHKVSNISGNLLKNNSITKIFSIISKKYDISIDLDVFVEKNIPIASGMGGGSSNAGAIINFCDKFYGLEMSTQDKIDIGQLVGADVPFFTQNFSAICSGTGEIIQPIKINPNIQNYSVLIIDLMEKTSTKNIYQAYDTLNIDQNATDKINYNNDICEMNLLTASKLGNDVDLLNLIKNTTNNLVFANDFIVYRTKSVLRQMIEIANNGLINFGITGAGSSMFLIYDDTQKARFAMTKAQINFLGCYVNLIKIVPNILRIGQVSKCGVYQHCA